MDMPWDVPEPQHFAEGMQHLSDSSSLLLETNEPSIPVFHSKGIMEFQPQFESTGIYRVKVTLNVILTWILCRNFYGKRRNSLTDKNYENNMELSNVTIYGRKYLL